VTAAAALLALLGAGAFPPPVTLDGVGGVRPGMTVVQVATRWGFPLHPDARAFGRACAPADFERAGARGAVFFTYGRFGAVSFDRGARTGAGVAIGSSEAALRRAYAGLLRSRHSAYGSGPTYYVDRRHAPHWRLRFEVAGRGERHAGHVTEIWFGTHRVASLDEACA
jgi:hypothetical protein